MLDTCFGCQYDKPGQRSHMGDGGCLSTDMRTNIHVRMLTLLVKFHCSVFFVNCPRFFFQFF